VITVVGELDIATAPRLADTLRRARTRAPIILDLTGVTFMDCAGLHPILPAHLDAVARRAPFILVLTPTINRLLQLAGVQDLGSRPGLPDAPTAATAQPYLSPTRHD
jgi:anti-anti-sigma factor